MDLVFTRHALQRMAERGVTREDVEQALNRQVGQTRSGRPGNLVKSGYATGGRILGVVVSAADERVVVSVWRSE
jgi:hypothetical protein